MPFKNLTAPVPQFRLTDGRAGLLVLDVFRFTVSPDAGLGRIAGERGILQELREYYEQVDQVVPNLVRLIEGCRAHGLPVIFTRLVAADADAVSPQAAVTGFWTRAGSPEAEFVPALAPRAGDEVIDKTTVSALARTPLDETLRRIGVRHLLVGGLLATGAVDLTARDAADLGYDVIVVSDACAGETWALHTVVSSTLVGGLIKLRTTSAVLEMLEGSRT